VGGGATAVENSSMSGERAKRAGETSPDAMGIDDAELARRKAFLELGDEDVRRLTALHATAHEYADGVIDEFYRHLLAFPDTAAYFRDPRTLGHVKGKQREYFLQLTSGEYGAAYVASRVAIGTVHQRINLPLKAYFGAYNFYVRAVAHRLLGRADVPPDVVETFLSLLKLIFLDINLALEAHVFQREQTIHAQQEMIRELSTPVLKVRDRLLIAPLIGVLDTPRARQLTAQLLRAIRDHRAKVVVLDITGVAVVDSAVANHLLQTVQASRLMGARVLITGISAEIAQTLVRIGVDFSQLETLGDLQEGIAEAERLLRVAPSAHEGIDADADTGAGAAEG
jgi:rsbT co-antagonist protein RsbR